MESPGHVVTQSEQYFGGLQLAISIDRQTKQNWNCTNCGCSNRGTSKHCGMCNALNQKYIIKAKDQHKQSMVKSERSKLLSSKEIFKKVKTHFPDFRKYKTIRNNNSLSRRRKSQTHNDDHKNNFDIASLNQLLDNCNLDLNPPDTQKDTISFIDSVFGNVDFTDPFGVQRDSDNDPHDTPFDYEFGFLSLNEDLPKSQPPKHARQPSRSAPSTPPSRRPRKSRIRINNKCEPLLIGVIHTPAPSRRDRLQTVFANVEYLKKYEYDGAMLINHGYSAQQLVPVLMEVHKKYPTLWLGANFMGIPDDKIFKFVKSNKLHKICKGIWCENSGIALDPYDLDDIFVHSYHKKATSLHSLHSLHTLDDSKEATPYKFTLGHSASTRSVDAENKKRVTFSALSGSLMSDTASTNNGTPLKTKTTASAPLQKIKKDDEFARLRLLQIKKYKYNGLYFGGVDLKQSNCIKIPTQKSIRTRRRTYSQTDVNALFSAKSPATASPGPSPRYGPKTPRTPRTPAGKAHRGKSVGSRRNSKSKKKAKRSSIKGAITLKKSLSSNTPIVDNVIANVSCESLHDKVKSYKSSKNRKKSKKNHGSKEESLLKAMDTALVTKKQLSIAKSLDMVSDKRLQLGTRSEPSMEYQEHEEEDEDDLLSPEAWIHSSQSLPHGLLRNGRGGEEYSSEEGDLDACSIYSGDSRLSESWSEFGSMNETLDDYFEALHKLGRFASDGYMHVITTSGKGKNIDIKLKALYEACSKKCLLAVASGVRFENIQSFLPYVDILMLSTCISHDFHTFDPRKMAKFKKLVCEYYKE